MAPPTGEPGLSDLSGRLPVFPKPAFLFQGVSPGFYTASPIISIFYTALFECALSAIWNVEGGEKPRDRAT